MKLAEKYRPMRLDDVVGQPKAVRLVRAMIERGTIAGNAFWISGPSGAGKTTLARIIAGEVADPFFVTEYDSGAELRTEHLDEIERSMHLSAWGKGGRAFVVNEAHGLSSRSIQRLLGILERIPPRVVFVFTTTWDGERLFSEDIDAGPFASRCVPIALTNQGLAQAFAARALEIARAEGLDGQPMERYVKLAQSVKNNMRAMLAKIEAGEMLTA